nr:polysaccharide biosynthesis/export family protein [Roseivivax halodurans]
MTASAAALLIAGACTAPTRVENIEPVETGDGYQAQYRAFAGPAGDPPVLRSAAMNAAKCRPYEGGGSGGKLGVSVPAALGGETLSRGDLLDLRLPDDVTFTGEYVVSRDGTLKVPFLQPIRAEGRTPDAVAADLRAALLSGAFYDQRPELSLLITDLAPVRVAVSGAVFEPQAVEIGNVSGADRDARRQLALGASTEGRNLSVALRSAGGIRPDADLSAIQLIRGGAIYTLDLRGVVEGRAVPDVILASGDELVVPSRQCFQDDLMRPSPISPPGVALYLSNLTQPATGNAPSAIGQEVREVPYGTRYLQAVVDANCVGGARATSAARSAALFSRNPVTDVSVVIERPIEKMRMRADRDDYDPYLLPGDAIACYDSSVTNVAEAARVLGIVGAVALIR